jgi:hypothetical protein
MLLIVQIWDAQNQEVTRRVGATLRRIASKIAEVSQTEKPQRLCHASSLKIKYARMAISIKADHAIKTKAPAAQEPRLNWGTCWLNLAVNLSVKKS